MMMAVLLLQADHEIEYLRLDGDVEGGGRFIRNQHLRVAREAHRDHGPLAHTAGELVRVLLRPPFGVSDTDVAQDLNSLLLRLALGDVLVDADGLADLVPDGEDGVEARHGVLEDHGDVVAPDLLHPLLGGLEQVLALEEDLTLRILDRRSGVETHDAESRHALAAAGLAHDPQCLPRLE
jgi:hypothetical protein